MKIKSNYLHEAREAEKRGDERRASEVRDKYNNEPMDAANKTRQTDSPVKEDLKFASLLETPAKPQKTNQQREETGGDSGGDDKKDNKDSKHLTKDSADNLTGGETVSEKYESFSGGGNFGGQMGFGSGDVNQLNLNENFAARSILHIADLERLVSSIRSQIALGGRREIILRLKRSVLEGLRVKITSDAAKVGIEFFAANEGVRSQIEKHSDELAGILRGRGIHLQSLTTSLYSGGENQESFDENNSSLAESSSISGGDLQEDNTFDQTLIGDGRKYNA